MTMGYGCTADDCKNQVNWLLTHMKPAATLPVCDEHYPVFAIGMLATELGVDAGRLYEAIKKFVDREAVKAAKAAADAYDAAQAEDLRAAAETARESEPEPMSRWAEDQTASGGLVIDSGSGS